MKAESFLGIDYNGNSNETNSETYQSPVEKLIYLAYNTWPDISFIVRQFRRYNLDPQIGHTQITKQIV